MAFTALTAAQTDANSPIDQTLTDLIRTNEVDLDARVSAIEASSHNDITDDFSGQIGTPGGLDSVLWNNTLNGSGDVQILAGHIIQVRSGGITTSDWAVIHSAISKIRVDMSDDYTVIMEFRIQSGGTVRDEMVVGLTDATQTGVNIINVLTNSIGIIDDQANSNWTVRVSSASGTTVDTDQGSGALWTKFKFTLVGGGAPTVDIEVDDVAIPQISGANVPTIPLMMMAGARGDGGGADRQIWLDYVTVHFQNRPLSTV